MTNREHSMELLHTEEKMNRYWTHRSESYSEINQGQFNSRERQAWERELFSGIDESKPLRVLDIGTGPGLFAILSALRGHEVTAVDMNMDMLKQAVKNAEAAGAKVKFQQVGHVLPFEPGSFDLIVSRDVTWTLPEPEETLRSWSELLAPNGTLRYFDAEWYYYLKNQDNLAHWQQSKKKIMEQGGSFYSRGNEMEEMAKALPMTYRGRPRWDKDFWKKCGLPCTVRENMNQLVYSPKEQIQYQNYAVFLVTVKKV